MDALQVLKRVVLGACCFAVGWWCADAVTSIVARAGEPHSLSAALDDPRPESASHPPGSAPPSAGLPPQIAELVLMAREDPAHAVAVWEKLSWCDGLSERRLRQAIGAVESRERLLQRGLGDQSLREGLERARQRMAEMETQEHLCAEIGARDFEALSWLEYAVGAGATNAYERAASSLLPRMSRASRIRH